MNENTEKEKGMGAGADRPLGNAQIHGQKGWVEDNGHDVAHVTGADYKSPFPAPAQSETGLPGGMTQAQLERLKRQHRVTELSLVSIPLGDEPEDGEAHGWFKKPTLEVIGAAMAFAEKDPLKAGQILFAGCFVEGDPQMQEDPEVKLSAMGALQEMMRVRTARIKKY